MVKGIAVTAHLIRVQNVSIEKKHKVNIKNKWNLFHQKLKHIEVPSRFTLKKILCTQYYVTQEGPVI
jgi:hypothetical protein